MTHGVDRRSFLAISSIGLAAGTAGAHGFASGGALRPAPQPAESNDHDYPVTSSDRAREFVGASHARLDRVREMLGEDPNLARAAWDWGFGDWETAIGAASHTGQIDIIDLLLAHGARPDLFTFAALDRVDAVRAILDSVPGARDLEGPHSISLHEHAQAGNASNVIAFLDSIDIAPVDRFGYTREQIAPFLGDYAWGNESADRFRIEWNERRGRLTILRPGGTARDLMPVNERAFSPSGARHVVLRFEPTANGAFDLVIPRGTEHFIARRVAD